MLLYTVETGTSERKDARKIVLQSQRHWGSWGAVELCPDKSFAKGFELKVVIVPSIMHLPIIRCSIIQLIDIGMFNLDIIFFIIL
jgi:hypothetical protein